MDTDADDSRPLAEVVRSRPWKLAAAGLLAGVLFAFHQTLLDMVEVWYAKADYSHGFLVLPFSLYLLWARRALLPPRVEWPNPLGLLPLLAGLALSLAAGRLNVAKEFAQGVGLILALAGVVVMLFGRYGLRWAWPGLLFLIFMARLPDQAEIGFLFKLRQVATQSSNFVLQTIGYQSYVGGPSGTIITVGDTRLGVEWACAGLSMVLTFVAVAVAVALLLERPIGDRLFVIASALPIAIVSNILRITLTALVYIAGWKQLGDLIVHDLAGYLMMPLALGFVWLELKLIDWLMVPTETGRREDVVKMATRAATSNWTLPPEAAR